MALTIDAKDPQEVRRFRWQPPLAASDTIASYTLVATGATIASSTNEDTAVELFVSGGTAATVATITATAVTDDGETLEETLYLPIIASTVSLAETANDVVTFALRKIAGMGNTPEASELEDGLEQLNMMLAMWRDDGLDAGLPLPLLSSTVLKTRDGFVTAIKWNLALALAENYDRPVTPMLASMAADSKRVMGNALLTMADLSFEVALLKPQPMTSIDDL